MPSTRQLTKQQAMLQIYTLCCCSIKRMPSLKAKRFCAQIATKIYPLMNWSESQIYYERKERGSESVKIVLKDVNQENGLQKALEIIQQKQKLDQETQTHQQKDKPSTPKSSTHIRSRSDRSELSFKQKRVSDSVLPETDQILEQTISKYEKCIETLYKQMQDLELQYENKLAQSQQNQKIQQSHRSAKSSKSCSCPVQQMQKEIDKLKKEIKKKDKNRIRKMKVGSKETGKFGVEVSPAIGID